MRAISVAILICAASAAVNQSALPMPIAYGGASSTGPDGPWWYVTAVVGPLDRRVDFFPGLSGTTLVIKTLACSAPGAQCPLSTSGSSMQTFDAAEAASDPRSRGEDLGVEVWDAQLVLRVDGVGQRYAESMAFQTDDAEAQFPLLVVMSENYTVRYPGGANYTMSTGLLSLWAGVETVTWPASNGSMVRRRLALPAAYAQGQIPSKSFGITVGSVNHNINGSLTLGDYDRSRCITDPIVSEDSAVQLIEITLGVAAGASSFIDLPQGDTSSLLRANGSVVPELSVRPNPAVPYIFLPQETCDAIASHLPVTYSHDFNLYLWNLSDPVYERIVKSPHYLSFTFALGDGNTAPINVPFALLNLTLGEPLTQTPTPYFPCSPWLPSGSPYNFGRAFLQAAFLARNFQEEKLYLSQAPGPDHAAPDVRKIASTDTSLPWLEDADWFSTWSSVLKALPEGSDDSSTTPGSNNSSTTPGTNSSTTTPESNESDEGASTATIAGSAVGAIAGVALLAGILFWWFRRRRRRAAGAVTAQQEVVHAGAKMSPDKGGPYPRAESASETVHEVGSEPRLVELSENREGTVRGRVPVELAAI